MGIRRYFTYIMTVS